MVDSDLTIYGNDIYDIIWIQHLATNVNAHGIQRIPPSAFNTWVESGNVSPNDTSAMSSIEPLAFAYLSV